LPENLPKRALLSVSNKASLPAFARGLVRLGFELYSTGGTLQALEEASIDVRSVTDLTEFPEMLDGRVKTLHPGVHAGLLARRDVPEHLEALEEHGLHTIDLLCCNLYPFAETVAREHVTPEQVLEQIDVGGPAMVRAAAKNYAWVIVVVRPERYAEVLTALGEGNLDESMRRRLAAEAFGHVAAYDSQIASWLRGREEEFPTELPLAGVLAQGLRYGENPHQKAAFYRVGSDPGGIGSARQLQGLDLSYNNIQDAAAACVLVCEYSAPAAAIIKHTNPCGLAVAERLCDAYLKAYDCDPTSAYGGVVAFNRELDGETAKQMGPAFLEVVIAPGFTPAARELFERKQKTRVLEVGSFRWNGLKVRSVPGGFLAQTGDLRGFDPASSRVVSRREPTAEEWEQLEFAWLAVKHVKSNAIVVARDHAAVGVGAGQMSRVEAAEIAMRRAGERARGAVMASDAFFPFADGVQVALKAGVTAVIQPGGSLRDREVVAAADEAGAAMVMTGERHFLH
jgi:phosphoribosylaminoimidazolecarboxamide formyltransferase/IMP cyclohydrolase